jgi:hypothetical protein
MSRLKVLKAGSCARQAYAGLRLALIAAVLSSVRFVSRLESIITPVRVVQPGRAGLHGRNTHFVRVNPMVFFDS